MSDLIQKQFQLEVKAVAEDGTFEGYASVFGNQDSDGEVIDKGAFIRSLAHKKGVLPILWQHDRKEPVGWNEFAEEDDHGLKVKGRLMIDTAEGQRAQSFLKMGIALGGQPGLSIGFMVPKNGDYVKDGVRHFKEVAWKEYSIVTFPANEAATVSSAKDAKDKERVPVQTDKEKADFETSLAEQQALSALWDERYQMDSALRDAICTNMDSPELSADQKKSEISSSLDQYCSAMKDWYGRFVDVNTDDQGEKEGRKISNATGKKLSSVLSHMKESEMHAKNAKASRRRAIGTLQEVLPAYYANDVNLPNPVGGKGDADELHSLLEATRGLTKSIRTQ